MAVMEIEAVYIQERERERETFQKSASSGFFGIRRPRGAPRSPHLVAPSNKAAPLLPSGGAGVPPACLPVVVMLPRSGGGRVWCRLCRWLPATSRHGRLRLGVLRLAIRFSVIDRCTVIDRGMLPFAWSLLPSFASPFGSLAGLPAVRPAGCLWHSRKAPAGFPACVVLAGLWVCSCWVFPFCFLCPACFVLGGASGGASGWVPLAQPESPGRFPRLRSCLGAGLAACFGCLWGVFFLAALRAASLSLSLSLAALCFVSRCAAVCAAAGGDFSATCSTYSLQH